MTDGARLNRFVRLRWGRDKGGIRGLAAALGTSPDTIYHWFNGTSRPDTGDLALLAEKLGVRRFEIVAALDGEETVMPLNDLTREAFVRLMDEWADSRGIRKPRQARQTGDGAA